MDKFIAKRGGQNHSLICDKTKESVRLLRCMHLHSDPKEIENNANDNI